MAAIAPVAPVPARQASPGAVFWACFLLFGVAALRVVSAIGSFYALPQVTRYYADAHGDGTAGTVAGVGLILLAVLSLVYALLALFDSRGMDPARIITWVVAGLTIILGALLLRRRLRRGPLIPPPEHHPHSGNAGLHGRRDRAARAAGRAPLLPGPPAPAPAGAADVPLPTAAPARPVVPATATATRPARARSRLATTSRPDAATTPATGVPAGPTAPTADAPARRAPDRAVARCSSPRRPTWSSPPG
jgi:hypothetical protein